MTFLSTTRLDKNVIATDDTHMATVVLTPEAVNDIRGLPLPIIARMQGLIERLRHWPMVSGAKPLKGDLAGKYRLRPGDYRLQFRVEQTKPPDKSEKGKKKEQEQGKGKEVVEYKVVVEKAGHRDGFYDE
jgi:mRNA-degrading endonuclease RelE of RelBE toxin-antitoxin system